MKYQNAFSLVFLIALFSCTSADKGENESAKTVWSDSLTLNQKDKEMKAVWDVFRSAILKNDPKLITKLSINCIHCLECYDNSTEENKYIQALEKNNPIKHSELSSHIYIPIKQFIAEDLKFYFNNFTLNEKNIGWINKRNKTYFENDTTCTDFDRIKSSYLEVSISNLECEGEECSQTIYSFVDTDDGYKFCGLIQVP